MTRDIAAGEEIFRTEPLAMCIRPGALQRDVMHDELPGLSAMSGSRSDARREQLFCDWCHCAADVTMYVDLHGRALPSQHLPQLQPCMDCQHTLEKRYCSEVSCEVDCIPLYS